MISIIAAIGKNREVGAKNALLWHIPGELKRFKEITIGHPIIMGRKTYESIGRVLPGRTNIIVTRDPEFKVDGAVIVDSLEKAIDIATNEKVEEIFIIGGGQIWAQSLGKNLVDRLYLTLIDKEFSQADVFFPDYSAFKKVIEKKDMVGPEFNYTFLTLEK